MSNISSPTPGTRPERITGCFGTHPSTKKMLAHIQRDYERPTNTKAPEAKNTDLKQDLEDLLRIKSDGQSKSQKDRNVAILTLRNAIHDLPESGFKTAAETQLQKIQTPTDNEQSPGDAISAKHSQPSLARAPEDTISITNYKAPHQTTITMNGPSDAEASQTVRRNEALEACIHQITPMASAADITTNANLIRQFTEKLTTIYPEESITPKKVISTLMAFLDAKISESPSEKNNYIAIKITISDTMIRTTPWDQLPSPGTFGLIRGYETRPRSEIGGRSRPTVDTPLGNLRADNRAFLGDGSYAKVKTGATADTEYAIKRIRLTNNDDETDYHRFVEMALEVHYGTVLGNHINILGIQDAYCYDDGKGDPIDLQGTRDTIPKFAIVMEKAGLDGLKFTNNSSMSFSKKLTYLADAGKGLVYMHSQGIAHCDFKLENTVLHKGHAKVTDFGMSAPIAVKDVAAFPYALYKLGATYPAPEALVARETGDISHLDLTKLDSYAFGVELHHLTLAKFFPLRVATYEFPRQAQDIPSFPKRVAFIIKALKASQDPGQIKLAQLIEDCTNEDPSKRIKITKAVNHLNQLLGR